MPEKILIVDDEYEITDLLELYLKNEGYTVYKFYSAKDALSCIDKTELDLAILDVMLPDMNGFKLCQKIREQYTYPIIMLTAKDEEIDKITGLTLGADDYITKPFRPLEVVARVNYNIQTEDNTWILLQFFKHCSDGVCLHSPEAFYWRSAFLQAT
jgi:two-component system response regulator VanR